MKLQSLLERFTLLERDMGEIYNYPVESVSDETAGELLFFFYEIEYKYSMLTTHRFTGSPQRYENILRIIEEQGRAITKAMAESFIAVFDEWLAHHAITVPREWAEDRVEQFEDYDDYEIFESADGEYGRYDNTFDKDLIQTAHRFESLRQYINAVNAESEAGQEEERIEYTPQSFIEDFGVDETFQMMNRYNSGLTEEFLIEVYQYVVFPAWFSHWKEEGIVGTRNRIIEINEILKKIETYTLKEQFGLVNEASNSVHQSGSMLQYYNGMFGIGEDVFDQYDQKDVDPWDAELREIGVEI